jgi:branched-chain amino acid transport system ATP-binding protein
MLEVRDLRAGYRAGEVLHGLTFSVAPGEIVALVGANGAGKSTTLKAISGVLRPDAGAVTVDGRVLSGRSSEEAVQAGMAHVPEGRQVFSNLSVADNLMLGAYATKRRGEPVEQRLADVLELFPALAERLQRYAGSLSGGEQQMLAIGRGLMSDPRYLLLDEPSVGLAPQVTTRIFEAIERLRDAGKGILLVEQNGRLALAISERAHLLEGGSITLSGTGEELLRNDEVVEHYLGVGTSLGSQPRREALTAALGRALAAGAPAAAATE